MGYEREFQGEFKVTPKLQPNHRLYLCMFSYARHMKRDEKATATFPDHVRDAVGLPVGKEGQYYVGGAEGGQYTLDHNQPPEGQPELHCEWIPSPDGENIIWSGNKKFYEYTAWLRYIIEHFLSPWGYTLNGTVKYVGEDSEDSGVIVVENNNITKNPDPIY